MAGYTRQSTADITANAVIKAAPVNAEYNALRDVFAFATGHKHDGSSTEGAYVPLIADVDALNKVVIDTINNRIGFFSQVGSGTVEQLRIQDGAFVPVTDSDIDLGAAGAEFKDLYIDGIGYIDTVAVHENATIAGTLGVTGLSTLATVDINGGNIDGTTIAGGTLNNAQIGNTAASTVVGTTVTASNFVGPIAGAVTGNVTGNTAGVHTGAVTGDVTGNVTAGSGSSSFTNVTINGSLDMNAGTSATITGLSTPVQNSDAATKQYVDTVLAATVDAAPAALDTLNELAAALGDDANYAATTTTALATKLPKAGGTMTGAIAMGTNKVTGLGAPTAGTDATTKTYVDAGDALQVLKAGDTMSGVLAMGANKITGVADPTTNQDAATKVYVDVILGSATAAATSASNASTSETNAGNSATAAAASYDSFDDRYLGPKSSAPTLDNDSASLLEGALYWNSTSNNLWAYTGSSWVLTAPNSVNQNLINIVGGELLSTEDLGSITAAVTSGTGNSISAVAAAIANVNTVAGISANVTTVAGISSDVTTVAGISANTTTVAGISANTTTVAGIASDVTAVAGKTAQLALLGTADAVADMNTLGTADVVSDMNTLGTADVVADMNTLGTADVVADMNTLGTADVVADMNTLGTSAIVSDMNTLAAISSNITSVAGNASNINSAVSNSSNINAAVSNASNINSAVSNSANINTVAGISSDVTTVSGNTSNINSAVSNASNINSAVSNATNINLVAGSISDVNAFVNKYRISSSAPTTSLDSGDLWWNTTSNELRAYNTSASVWAATAPTAANQLAIDIVAGDILYTEDNGSITQAVTTGVGAGMIATVGSAIANVNSVGGSIANVNSVAGNSSNINAAVSNASNINAAVSNASNITSVAGNSSNINLAAGSITNVNLVAGSIANVNTVGSSIADVNRYANEYQIASSAPASPSQGDLWLDTVASVLKYYTGSAWSGIISGITSVAADSSPQLAGALDGQNNNLTNIGTISGTNLQLDFGGL